MTVVYKVGKKMPKTCDKCKLFTRYFGSPAYCAVGAEYTDKEIEAEEDGNLNMYYHGCLTHRPMNCPLVEIKEVEE